MCTYIFPSAHHPLPEAVRLPGSRLLPLLPPGGLIHPGHARPLSPPHHTQRHDHKEAAGGWVDIM